MKGFKIRLSRTFLLIIGGVTILGGGSGVAAVYIGADKLLGPPYSAINGLECTTVDTVKIKKADRYWIRKYVTADGSADGISRLKTALRVARKVQQTEHPDLVQVTVLDAAGPTERSKMRGRAIGAQVVYIPDLAKAPAGTAVQPIMAYYVEGKADESGEFWGLRFDLPLEEAEHLSAKLTDDADCLDDVAGDSENHGSSGGHGTAAEHGKAKGHEAPAAHGESETSHGGGDHGGEPAVDAYGADIPVAEHDGGEKAGWMASLMGMVGLGGGESEAHDAAPASAHEPPAEDDLPKVNDAKHGTAEHQPAARAVADEAEAPAEDVATHPAEEAGTPEGEGWFTAVKGMIGLGETAEEGTPEHPVPALEKASVEAAHAKPKAEAGAEDAPPANADEHGAAWLAKMRAQPLVPEGESAPGPDAHVDVQHSPVMAEEDDPEQHRRKPDAHAENR